MVDDNDDDYGYYYRYDYYDVVDYNFLIRPLHVITRY